MKTTTRSLFIIVVCLALLAAASAAAAAPASVLAPTPTTNPYRQPATTASPGSPAATAAPASPAATTAPGTPTFNIIAVTPGVNVTIQAFNFPARTSFDAYMGPEDTKAVDGALAGQVTSGTGGAFTATFKIPAVLKTTYKVGLRLQATAAPDYYVYNWFYNDKSSAYLGGDVNQPSTGGLQPSQPGQQGGAYGQSGQPGGQSSGQSGQVSGQSSGGYGPYTMPSGRPIPTIAITAVKPDQSVTFTTYNFPANDVFEVQMGLMGTRALNGIPSGRIDSGKGGTQTYTIQIPPALYGQSAIAIRVQSISGSGYYAYNWFNNAPGWWGYPPPGPPPPPGQPGHGGYPPGYYGFPTFSIISVVPDNTVNIQAYNLPPNKVFQVRMGPMGTRGIGGYIITSFDTGTGGMQSLSFPIPAPLYGQRQIAIRMQATDYSGFYAYNWFYNR